VANLFRPEVIEGRRQSWLGHIQLIRPVPLIALTAVAACVAVAVGAFLVEGRYTRKAHITGYLVPDRGVLRLLPPQSGVVLESRAVEGRSVRAGDVLFVLSVDQSTLSGGAQAAVQGSLQLRSRSLQEAGRQKERLLIEQQGTLDRQLAAMRRELVQHDGDTEVQAQRVAIARDALARVQSLKDDNFVSSAQVQDRQKDLLAVQAQGQTLSRQRSQLEREIDALEAQRRELPMKLQAQQGEIERDIAAIAQLSAEAQARQSVVVRAPQDGVVTAVLAQVGQTATPATALASLLPADARLQAQLFAPSSAVGFVRAQQKVQLRYQAFPYQKFGHYAGQVMQVSRTPLQTSELAGLPLPEWAKAAPSAEPLYRITVTLDQQAVQVYGQAQPLVPGMQIDADVLLDRRRLIEWIFEPLLSVSGRV